MVFNYFRHDKSEPDLKIDQGCTRTAFTEHEQTFSSNIDLNTTFVHPNSNTNTNMTRTRTFVQPTAEQDQTPRQNPIPALSGLVVAGLFWSPMVDLSSEAGSQHLRLHAGSELQGLLWNFDRFHWISMDFIEFRWIPSNLIDFIGFLLI